MKRDGIRHAPLSSDQEFLRRAYVDATGTLPTADEVRAFVASTDPAKRNKLVDKLVESEEFAEQFSWLWGDMLNQQDPAYNYWIKEFLRADRPYNEVVTDMMSGVAKTHTTIPALGLFSDAYVGTNSSPMNMDDYRGLNRLDTLDYFAIASSRVLLGMNTSCISCHDGAGHLEPVNLYLSEKTREEFWKSAAFHGKMRMIGRWDDRSKNNTSADLHLDELATAQAYNTSGDWPWPTASMNLQPRDGRTYEPAFLLTGEKPRPGENPRLAYARMVTSHPQFRRAAVNIMWGKLMTVGFVEPYDGFDLARLDPKNPPPAPWTLQPTNAELLQALADDFGKNNFSLQHVAKTIMKSSAYQLSSHYDGEWKAAYVPYYARRLVRVMTGPELDRRADGCNGEAGRFRQQRQEGRARQAASWPRVGQGGRVEEHSAELFPEQSADTGAGRESRLDAAGAAADEQQGGQQPRARAGRQPRAEAARVGEDQRGDHRRAVPVELVPVADAGGKAASSSSSWNPIEKPARKIFSGCSSTVRNLR